jgi:5-oxoprolinase (ATP-hydrolysing)
MLVETPWKIWIDTGGTFTDCIAVDPEKRYHRLKVLSNGLLRVPVLEQDGDSIVISPPITISRDFLKGFTIVAGKQRRTITRYEVSSGRAFLNRPLPKLPKPQIELLTDEEVPVFAARILTQTSLNEAFPSIEMKLGSTRGTNALLERKGARTALLITGGFKDLLTIGNQQRRNLFALAITPKIPLYHIVLEVDERITRDGTVLKALRKEVIDRIVQTLRKKRIASVAVAFLNSYKNPVHEQEAGEILSASGFKFVSLSQLLSPQVKILPRAETTVANAYLDPVIHQYVDRIRRGLSTSTISIMSSAGGLLPVNDFKPKDSLLSGPAGGVIGAIAKAGQSGHARILTFDMGGTSTDVSRCHGRPDYRFDCTVGDLKIFSPSLAIETIAAGGGSICDFDGYRLTVGPESAGASPGPACYGAGGPLTITDVNLLLGRLDPENFSIPIDVSAANVALQRIVSKLSRAHTGIAQAHELLLSLITIANEKMAEAIRRISVQQGHDPADHTLFCFGGAGGQHACALAGLLNIGTVLVPYEAGLLSAYGIGHAPPESIQERQVLMPLKTIREKLDNQFDQLEDHARDELKRQGYTDDDIVVSSRLAFLRLMGQETSLEVTFSTTAKLAGQFADRYRVVYGHWLPEREIEVESIRLIASKRPAILRKARSADKLHRPRPLRKKNMYTAQGWRESPVYRWEALRAGASFRGPALIISDNSTVFVDDGWRFDLDTSGNASFRRVKKRTQPNRHVAAAQLELFTNRFSAIATEMGTLLQRTSFSVNIKERLDFSCAVLDHKGNLVVNAPHIPVHLGSLGACIRSVIRTLPISEGDVVVTNHPGFGGSHLPDVTIIKPVHCAGKRIGFVASRAHHAEIGGTRPGSMPADAVSLEEEGVVISPTYLIRKGKPQWDDIQSLLCSATYPTRALSENLADINGALASVMLGATALNRLCRSYGADTVKRYMKFLHQYAAELVKAKIKTMRNKYRAIERLDDGTPIRVDISRVGGDRLRIDFAGSGAVHKGNLNATPAIVTSVVLYVLRLLLDREIPLNEGMMIPIDLVIPECCLNPTFNKRPDRSPAVVGGNTEVSQRLTDVLLKALHLAACSQGTMNNFLFGDDQFGYYETICGGVGATPGANGADAVHQHMTNTRITDPEIIELRYPVRLEKFGIWKGSGGTGKYHGGNGVVRQFYFEKGLEINLLAQHRIVPPYGVDGGQHGKTGQQSVIKSDGTVVRLKGCDGYTVEAGDRVQIKTPGGGGWGKK